MIRLDFHGEDGPFNLIVNPGGGFSREIGDLTDQNFSSASRRRTRSCAVWWTQFLMKTKVKRDLKLPRARPRKQALRED
jgi:hypothetical protein